MLRYAVFVLPLLLISPAVAQAQAYKGFYLGAQAGFQFNNFDTSAAAEDPEGTIGDLVPDSLDDFAYSVVAGYNFALPLGLRAGVELEYERSTGEEVVDAFSDPSVASLTSFDFGTGDAFSASARLGWRGLGFGLLYAKAGFVTGDFNAGLSRIDASGFRLGAGFEFPILFALKGRIEANYTDFGESDEIFSATETVDSPIDADIERINVRGGLVLYF